MSGRKRPTLTQALAALTTGTTGTTEERSLRLDLLVLCGYTRKAALRRLSREDATR